MNQVHLIALNYCWALEDIMGLASKERIEYAEMIYEYLKAKSGVDTDDY